MPVRKIATVILLSNLLIIKQIEMKVNFVVRRTKKKVDGTVPIEIYIKKMNTENGLFPPDCIIVGGLRKGHTIHDLTAAC